MEEKEISVEKLDRLDKSVKIWHVIISILFVLIIQIFVAATWITNIERDIKEKVTIEDVRRLIKEDLAPMVKSIDGIASDVKDLIKRKWNERRTT